MSHISYVHLVTTVISTSGNPSLGVLVGVPLTVVIVLVIIAALVIVMCYFIYRKMKVKKEQYYNYYLDWEIFGTETFMG